MSDPTSPVNSTQPVRPWYLTPRNALLLGPVLLAGCLGLRFGWGGLEGPPFPFWGVAYLLGAAGIFLIYVGILDRGRA